MSSEVLSNLGSISFMINSGGEAGLGIVSSNEEVLLAFELLICVLRLILIFCWLLVFSFLVFKFLTVKRLFIFRNNLY